MVPPPRRGPLQRGEQTHTPAPGGTATSFLVRVFVTLLPPGLVSGQHFTTAPPLLFFLLVSADPRQPGYFQIPL